MKLIKRLGLTAVFTLILNFIVELLKFRPVGVDNSGANLFITLVVIGAAWTLATRIIK